MFSEDYILRMINQAILALLYLARLRKSRQYQQAQQVIDQSLEELLGLRADLLKQLDDEVIFRMLTMHEQLDIERVEVIADLFKVEGDILVDQNRQAEGMQSYLRALNFYLEAGLSDQPGKLSPALTQKIESLAGLPDIMPLPDDIQWSLFNYYELYAEYAKADATLTELANRPGVYVDLQPEMIAFYQRLLALPPAVLARNRLERAIIQAKLDKPRPDS
jgi:hypothetical protein